MNMAVITISREPFSGGSTLGQAIATTLGYRFVDKKVMAKVFQQYGLISFDDFYNSPLSFWELVDETNFDYMQTLRKVIATIGSLGNVVILGRGSFAVFPGFADVLNVRLWAPLDVRVDRYLEQISSDDRIRAEKEVARLDHIRESFVSRCFRGNVERANAFDLVINTGKVREAVARDMIVEALRDLERTLRPIGLFARDLEIDTVMKDAVEKALEMVSA